MDAAEVDAVEVVAGKPRGSVEGDIKPDLTSTPAQLRAYGAGSISELLAFLEPQLRSQPEPRRRPAGDADQRASHLGHAGDPRHPARGHRALRDPARGSVADLRLPRRPAGGEHRPAPPLPRPDQRSGPEGATAGGRTSTDLQSTLFRVQGDQRWLFNGKISHDTPLFETERDIVRAPSGSPYDLTGNVTGLNAPPTDDAAIERRFLPIDPALTNLVGFPATIALVPTSALVGAPTLADFAADAVASGDRRPDGLSQPVAQEHRRVLTGAVTRPLGKSSMATISGSFEDNSTLSYLGLPGVLGGGGARDRARRQSVLAVQPGRPALPVRRRLHGPGPQGRHPEGQRPRRRPTDGSTNGAGAPPAATSTPAATPPPGAA